MFFSFRTARQGRGTAHTGAASRPKLSHSRFFQRKRLSGGFSASSCRISRKKKAGLLPSPQSQKQSIQKESQYFFKKTLDFLLHPCYDNEAVSQEAHGVLAQLGERHTGSVEVSGSIPLCSTKIRTFCECMRFGFFIFRQNSRGAVISDGAPADVFYPSALILNVDSLPPHQFRNQRPVFQTLRGVSQRAGKIDVADARLGGRSFRFL